VQCIDEWAKSLHQRFGGPIAIALELAKGPIVYALQKYDFLVLFRSTRWRACRIARLARRAGTIPRCRTGFGSSGVTQSDLRRSNRKRRDATLISLTERRRELVDDKTRITNRLTTPSSNTTLRPWTGSINTTRCCSATS
jgi:hypothetical protein